MRNKNATSMYRNMQPAAQGPVKAKYRAKGVGTDTCTISSRYIEPVVVGSGRVFRYEIVPQNQYTSSVGVANMAACYEYFRIKSMRIEFVPVSGSTAPGSLVWAFIDSPAGQYLAYNTSAYADVVDIVNSTSGCSSCSVGFPAVKVWNNQRIVTRPWFATSYVMPTTLDAFDRVCPSTLLGVFNGEVDGSKYIGNFVFNITYEFRGLGLNAALSTLSTLEGVPRFQCRAKDFPDEVELYNNTSATARYVLKPASPKPAES